MDHFIGYISILEWLKFIWSSWSAFINKNNYNFLYNPNKYQNLIILQINHERGADKWMIICNIDLIFGVHIELDRL